MRINVAGGTGAGVKRPLLPGRRDPWQCKCGRINQGFVVRCLNTGCNRQRPS